MVVECFDDRFLSDDELMRQFTCDDVHSHSHTRSYLVSITTSLPQSGNTTLGVA